MAKSILECLPDLSSTAPISEEKASLVPPDSHTCSQSKATGVRLFLCLLDSVSRLWGPWQWALPHSEPNVCQMLFRCWQAEWMDKGMAEYCETGLVVGDGNVLEKEELASSWLQVAGHRNS